MDEVNLIKTSYSLIRKDFGLEDDISFEGTQSDIDRLREWLVTQINYLLDYDFNGLLNALYRIDIPEEKVKKVFQLPNHEDLSANLADLIIEREKQKVITRLKYFQE